jgi:hypothetical protein
MDEEYDVLVNRVLKERWCSYQMIQDELGVAGMLAMRC